MRHEHRLERAVLAPQPLHHPEEERLGELAVAVGHAARDIQHEEHHRVHRRLAPPRQLAKAQVLVGEGLGGTGRAAALHQLLEGAAPVEPRARAAPVPALADPVAVVGGPGARLEVRQLHLLPDPVDDVVDLELEQQLHLAFITSARALLAGSLVARRIGQYVAGLGLALARALGFFRASQAEMVVLEHAHRHAHRACAAVDDVAAGDDLGQIGAHRLAHLLVVTQPVARPAREQLVPFAGRGGIGAAALLVLSVHVLVVLLFRRRGYSCASSVVT